MKITSRLAVFTLAAVALWWLLDRYPKVPWSFALSCLTVLGAWKRMSDQKKRGWRIAFFGGYQYEEWRSGNWLAIPVPCHECTAKPDLDAIRYPGWADDHRDLIESRIRSAIDSSGLLRSDWVLF